MSFIDELKRLNEAATPNWTYVKHGAESQWSGNVVGSYGRGQDGIERLRTISCQTRYGTPEEVDANAAIIALLRNKAPAIIALVECAKKVVDNAALFCDEEIELEQALSALEDGNG